jgi:hypothetical protein
MRVPKGPFIYRSVEKGKTRPLKESEQRIVNHFSADFMVVPLSY